MNVAHGPRPSERLTLLVGGVEAQQRAARARTTYGKLNSVSVRAAPGKPYSSGSRSTPSGSSSDCSAPRGPKAATIANPPT